MAEKPILFSDKMVQAILSDTKTQTRRLLKPQPTNGVVPKPKFNVGDVLWVREAWRPDPSCDDAAWDEHHCSYYEWSGCGSKVSDIPTLLQKPEYCIYRASFDGHGLNWNPSLFMPRWASRLQLEVTVIRMERLNDITEDDAEAEGMLECVGMFSEREYIQIAEQIGSEINDLKPYFVQLWQSIYGPDSWSENPWVWVIEFKVAQVGEE